MASWQGLLVQLFLYGPDAVSLACAENPSHLEYSQFFDSQDFVPASDPGSTEMNRAPPAAFFLAWKRQTGHRHPSGVSILCFLF